MTEGFSKEEGNARAQAYGAYLQKVLLRANPPALGALGAGFFCPCQTTRTQRTYKQCPYGQGPRAVPGWEQPRSLGVPGRAEGSRGNRLALKLMVETWLHPPCLLAFPLLGTACRCLSQPGLRLNLLFGALHSLAIVCSSRHRHKSQQDGKAANSCLGCSSEFYWFLGGKSVSWDLRVKNALYNNRNNSGNSGQWQHVSRKPHVSPLWWFNTVHGCV